MCLVLVGTLIYFQRHEKINLFVCTEALKKTDFFFLVGKGFTRFRCY